MKKLMLSVAAFACVSSPAFAQDNSGVKLGIGGEFAGYVSYVDQDETVGNETRNVDILRRTKVLFTGETDVSENLKLKAVIRTNADSNDSFSVDRSYLSFGHHWGQVRLGLDKGAASLLQVEAPSADDHIDGVDQHINPFNYANATANTTVTDFNDDGMDYSNSVTEDDDKLTYLSPILNGFQAGASYTPEITDESDGVSGNNDDDTAGDRGAAWEAGIRYAGMVNAVGVILGAGYTHIELEEDFGTVDDFTQWNVGADLDIGAFGVGAAYTENNNRSNLNDENQTWVVGADYTTGPFKLGVSYFNNTSDASGVDVESDRIAGGVVYTYGPGMTFRGSIQHVQHDIEAADDVEGTAVLLGTQVNF